MTSLFSPGTDERQSSASECWGWHLEVPLKGRVPFSRAGVGLRGHTFSSKEWEGFVNVRRIKYNLFEEWLRKKWFSFSLIFLSFQSETMRFLWNSGRWRVIWLLFSKALGRNSCFHSASGLIKVSSDVSRAYTESFSHNVRENSSDKGLHSERNCL